MRAVSPPGLVGGRARNQDSIAARRSRGAEAHEVRDGGCLGVTPAIQSGHPPEVRCAPNSVT
jgi:hypothetical protein